MNIKSIIISGISINLKDSESADTWLQEDIVTILW